MAAMFGRTEVGLRKTGTTATVPNNPKAKLMYYLSCISNVLDMRDEEGISDLVDYSRYYFLPERKTRSLVALCLLLSPDVLTDKVIFQDADMCGDSSNEFYELSVLRNNMFLSDSILIGGRTRRVRKVMFFRASWIRNNWTEPMRHFTR